MINIDKNSNVILPTQIIDIPKIHQCSCPQILIVDDEPFNLIPLAAMIANIAEGLPTLNGGKVDKAYNGKQAFNMIEANVKTPECQATAPQYHHEPYKLVIMDKNMPVMSGVESARAVKAEWTRLLQEVNRQQRHDPRLEVAANALGALRLALLSGDKITQDAEVFDYILQKPIEGRELARVVKDAFEERP